MESAMTHREWIQLLRKGSHRAIRAVLDAEPERARACDLEWLSALGAALFRDDPEVVGWMLAAGADPNARFELSSSLSLPNFVGVRSLAVARLLDQAGARWTDAGWASLASAVRRDDLDLLTWLIEKGARPSRDGLEEAWREHPALLDPLLAVAGTDEMTGLLQRAAEEGDTSLVENLLARGADLRATLALHRAAESNHADVVRMLVAAGDDVNRRDPADGSTALLAATFEGAQAVAALLLELGADPSAANTHGQTPLDGALQSGDEALVALLRAAIKEV